MKTEKTLIFFKIIQIFPGFFGNTLGHEYLVHEFGCNSYKFHFYFPLYSIKMPNTLVKKSAPKTSKKSDADVAVEVAPVATPAAAVEEPVSSAVVDSSVDSKDVSSLQAEANALIELARQCQTLLQTLIKGTRATAANIRKLERDVQRLDKKSRKSRENRSTNGNKGLQQLKPVYTAEMKSFFENNKSLNDNDGVLIVDNLTYDSEHLLVSRKQALKLVTSYIKHHNLQDSSNKRRINMDATLQHLFPELCAVKDKKGKVVQEENCYYNTLMKALSRHFTPVA
jgi:chromatin remodeling complex protein RSC6